MFLGRLLRSVMTVWAAAGMKIKERVLRDQAALSGLQLGLMAAEHRLSLALIWMSTRRLVLCLPASLCALPPLCASE